MYKVYLAKSNRGNPDTVMAVRNILSRYNVEVVEFKGGAYSHKPLLECDYLVVVPELTGDSDDDAEYLSVGKGLFEQINIFLKTNKKSDMFIINYFHENSGEVGLGKFEDFDVSDEDDYINYADICFDVSEEGIMGNLTQALENRFGYQTTSTKGSTKSRYRLLLTKGS